MKKLVFLFGLFVALFSTATLVAQNPVIVSGNVYSVTDSTPVSDWFVLVGADTANLDPTGFAFTDGSGHYEVVIDVPTGTASVTIVTQSDCGNGGDPFVFEVAAVVNGAASADLYICSDTNWGGGGCYADFYPNSDPLDPLTVTFEDYSYAQVISWSWDFGDGATSAMQSPTHTYAAGGTYAVTLTIQTADSCSSSATYLYYAPVVFNNPVTVTGYVYFEGTTDPVPAWPVFGGGDPSNPWGGSAFAETDVNGFYTIVIDMDPALSVVDVATLDLCSGIPAQQTVTITNGVGSADFYICDDFVPPPSDCGAMVNINQIDDYNFSFTADLFPPGATANAYHWDFGDGTTSTDAAPSHTYTQDGVYTVFLEVELDSCTAHACEIVFVGNGHPPCDTFLYGCQAMFFVDYNPNNTSSFTFTDFSIGAVADWEWNMGDGTVVTGLPVVDHTYTQDGIYTVTLTITTVDGCESSMSMVVEAPFGNFWNEPDCQAMFLPLPVPDSLTGDIDLTYFFLNMSFAPLGITSYAWDFGDGSTSTEENPLHTYAAAGSYDVTLTILGDSCDSQITFPIDTDNFDNFTGGGALGQSSTPKTSVKDLATVKGMALSPNPVTSSAVLAFESTASKPLRYSVADMSGRTLKTWTSDATQGMNVQTLETADLQPGMYSLFVQDETGVQTMRFVKQ